MSEHAAFLRGMNLGGRRITNEGLREAFAAIGFTDVRTFRASGNVCFVAAAAREPQLRARIEEGLLAKLGYAVPTFVRTAAEVRAIAEHDPFPAGVPSSFAGKLQVGLLAQKPSASAVRHTLALAGEQDVLALHGRELYWLPSGGLLDSPLDVRAVAALLGEMTVRTKGTIAQLAAKHFARG